MYSTIMYLVDIGQKAKSCTSTKCGPEVGDRIAIGDEANMQVLTDNSLWWNPSMGSSAGKTRITCTSPAPETVPVPDKPLQIWAMADT
jgi:hypothetical protein